MRKSISAGRYFGNGGINMGRHPKQTTEREEELKGQPAYEWYVTNWEGQETDGFTAWWAEWVKWYDFERGGDDYWLSKGFALAGWRGRQGASEVQAPFEMVNFLSSLHQVYDVRSKKSRGLARPMAGRTRSRRKPKPQRLLRSHQKFDDGEPKGRCKKRRTVSPLGNVLTAAQERNEAAMEKKRLQDWKMHKKRRARNGHEDLSTNSGPTEEREIDLGETARATDSQS